MKIFRIIVPIICLVFFLFLAQNRTDGFRISRIKSSQPHNLNLGINNQISNEELDYILSQDFSYLSRGRQCFVFESADKKYVIKFFDHYRFYRPYYFPNISLPKKIDFYREKRISKRKRRLDLFLNSYKIAYNELKDETGLLFVHLNNSNDLKRNLKVKNKCSQQFSIDLDLYPFVIQRKSKPIFEAYQELKINNEHYLIIDSFIEFINKRCKRNISDDDIDVGINFGVIDKKIINFDSGRLFYDNRLLDYAHYKKEMLKSSKLFKKWLIKNYPDDVSYFDKRISSILKSE